MLWGRFWFKCQVYFNEIYLVRSVGNLEWTRQVFILEGSCELDSRSINNKPTNKQLKQQPILGVRRSGCPYSVQSSQGKGWRILVGYINFFLLTCKCRRLESTTGVAGSFRWLVKTSLLENSYRKTPSFCPVGFSSSGTYKELISVCEMGLLHWGSSVGAGWQGTGLWVGGWQQGADPRPWCPAACLWYVS